MLHFMNNQYDPFNADLISLQKDSTKIINLQLDKMQITGNSISGFVTDSISLDKVKKGVLVVRTGTHTPSKISANVNNKIIPNGIYTTFIKPDGSYSIQNVLNPGYFYVQAFSDYYIPSFYNFAQQTCNFLAACRLDFYKRFVIECKCCNAKRFICRGR